MEEKRGGERGGRDTSARGGVLNGPCGSNKCG